MPIPFIDLQAQRKRLLARPGQAPACAVGLGQRTGDHSDAPMAEPDQITRGLPETRRVIGENRVDRERQLAVEQERRDAQFAQPRDRP